MNISPKQTDNTDPILSRCQFSHAGITLSYLDNRQTSSQPPVFLLHGFTASAKSNWYDTQWITLLTQAKRRVIAIDARGHGDSDKPYDSQWYPSNVMMQDGIFLMKSLGFAHADFIGYSMGARMSAYAAICYPKKIRRLVIGGMGINLKNGIGNPQPIADALHADDIKQISNRHARKFRRLAEKGDNDLTALAHCIMSSRQSITESCLKKIRAATLIIVGDEDETGGCPHTLAPYINKSIAKKIEGCNHFNALTNQKFRQTSIDFIINQ